MTEAVNNGVSNLPRLTQSSYRHAGAETVAALRNGHSDQDFADLWGVSATTVNNAQNKRNDLAGMSLLKLAERFGPAGVNTFLALVGLKAVRDSAACFDVSRVPHEVATVLPLLIELFADGECCDNDIRVLEEAGAIETFLRVADMLRQRRDSKRLKAVGE